MSKLKELQEAAAKAAADAREIAEKAANESRSMTDDERSDFDKHMAKGADLLAQIKVVKADQEVLAQAKALADEIGPMAADDVDAQAKSHDPEQRVKSLGLQVVKSKEFGDMCAQFPGGRVPDGYRVQSAPISVKGLITGAGATSAGAFVTPDNSGIYEALGRRPLTLRDIISVRRTGSDVVEYVQQTAQPTAADVVPEALNNNAPTAPSGAGALVRDSDGGYKPEGAFAFARKQANVVTIAEWVPATKRALADVAALEGLINDELAADVAQKEEDEILNANDTNFKGIANAGIQTQSFVNDIFTTIRKALTKAKTIGRVQPNAILVSPEDAEIIDLARENGKTGAFVGPGPFGAFPRTMWGVPVVESQALSQGTGYVGDFRKAVLWDREQTTVTVSDSHEDYFIRNMVAILAEERVAFALTRPYAVCSVTIEDGSSS